MAPLEKKEASIMTPKKGAEIWRPSQMFFYAKISAPDFSKSGTKIFFPLRSLMIPYL